MLLLCANLCEHETQCIMWFEARTIQATCTGLRETFFDPFSYPHPAWPLHFCSAGISRRGDFSPRKIVTAYFSPDYTQPTQFQLVCSIRERSKVGREIPQLHGLWRFSTHCHCTCYAHWTNSQYIAVSNSQFGTPPRDDQAPDFKNRFSS